MPCARSRERLTGATHSSRRPAALTERAENGRRTRSGRERSSGRSCTRANTKRPQALIACPVALTVSRLCRSTMYPLRGARNNPATLEVSSRRPTRLDPPAWKPMHAGRTMPTPTIKNDAEKNLTKQSRCVACISNSFPPALQEVTALPLKLDPGAAAARRKGQNTKSQIRPFPVSAEISAWTMARSLLLAALRVDRRRARGREWDF
ncbi:hypothetical protein ABH984_006174 [Bradyrhizobium ottawaense]